LDHDVTHTVVRYGESRPINTAAANFVTDEDVSSISANVNNLLVKPLYTCPSGRAATLINNKVDISALLDDGSECLSVLGNNLVFPLILILIGELMATIPEGQLEPKPNILDPYEFVIMFLSILEG
jgi:hypothetical protein